MSTLTIRLPDDTAERLKSLTKARGLSVNKIVERMTYEAIASFDTEARFRALAARTDIPDRPPNGCTQTASSLTVSAIAFGARPAPQSFGMRSCIALSPDNSLRFLALTSGAR